MYYSIIVVTIYIKYINQLYLLQYFYLSEILYKEFDRFLLIYNYIIAFTKSSFKYLYIFNSYRYWYLYTYTLSSGLGTLCAKKQ